MHKDTDKKTAIRILIADNHSFFRDGLRLLIENTEGFDIVGEVGTALDAVSFAQNLQPDIILMDVRMPPSDGIEATKEIMSLCPDIKILILTMFNDEDNVFKALQAGAHGYVLKGIGHEELICTMRLIANGNAVYGNKIASQIQNYFTKAQHRNNNQHITELSQRENHILNLIAKGLRNKEIATECNIAEKTVRNHVSSILSKLRVVSRGEAVEKLRETSFEARAYSIPF